MSPVLLLSLLGAAPCGPVTPAEPDRALATIYFEVGEAAFATEDWESAATAFARALAHDPSLGRAAALREQACLSLGEHSFSRVEALMDAKRWREALAVLDAFPQSPPGSRALLEGVCHLELGEDEAASQALQRALKDPAHVADARVLLSLLALRRGSARAAEEQLRALESGGRSLGAPLSALLRQASRGGAFTARASVFGGVDSNPALAPGMGTANGLLGFTTLLQFVPMGAVSPYARVAAGARDYPGLAELRTFTGVGTLGFQVGRGGDRVAVDYSLEGALFGPLPYSVTHGPRVEGSLQLGPVLLFAEWTLRFERFLPGDAVVFSGLKHEGALGAATALPLGFSVEAGWSLTRDDAQLRELASFEQGPRLAVGWAGGRTRATAGAALDWRAYDVFDADLDVQRSDFRVRPSVRVEVDLTDWLSLFAMGDASFVASNVEAVRAVRVAASGGAQLWVGLW